MSSFRPALTLHDAASKVRFLRNAAHPCYETLNLG